MIIWVKTFPFHDDVIKWKHFLHFCPFVRGIHRWSVNSPHKGPVPRSFVWCLVLAWTNGWVNNRIAVSVTRPRAYYDVTVMPWCHTVPLGLSTVEIHAQGFVFLLAGYETISNNLTVLLYCLATHPEVQERAQQEVDEAFGDKVGVVMRKC